MARRSSSGWANRAILATVVLAIPAFFVIRGLRRGELETLPGKASGAFVVPGDRPLVALHDQVSTRGDGVGAASGASGYRWTILDAATGAKLAERVEDDEPYYDCAAATSGRAWCSDEKHLYVMALPEFKQLLDVDQLIAAITLPPRIAGKIKADPDGAARFLVSDGRAARVDPVNLTASIARGDDIIATQWGGQHCVTRGALALGADGTLTFAPVGDQQQQAPVHVLPHTHGNLPPAADAPRFFDPGIVDLTDKSVLFVEHRASLAPDAPRKLSRVDHDGKVLWTVDSVGKCEALKILGDELVVTTRSAGQRAFAVDLASGKLLWKFGHAGE